MASTTKLRGIPPLHLILYFVAVIVQCLFHEAEGKI